MSSIHLISRSSGFRVAMIAKGAAEECSKNGLSLVWREVGNITKRTLSGTRALLFWGRLDDFKKVSLMAKTARLPIISTIGHTLGMRIHTVIPNPELIGQIVARHLSEEQFSSFAYVGPKHRAAVRRYKAYRETLFQIDKSNAVSSYFFDSEERFWDQRSLEGKRFLRFVDSLPKPLGLFAFSDQTAFSCLDCLSGAGIAVPAEIAVVGVDDHPLYSQMSSSLTSVHIDYAELGRVAVRVALAATSKNKSSGLRSFEHFIPGDLVVRASSQFRIGNDPGIARVIELMQTRYAEKFPLTVMARMAGMSRAAFAKKFLETTGKTPVQFLIDIRLRHASKMLTSSGLSIQEIAEKTGFGEQAYFSKTFKKHTGKTPMQFRNHKASK